MLAAMERTLPPAGPPRLRTLAPVLLIALAATLPTPAGAATTGCAGASVAVSSGDGARDVSRIRGAVRCLVTQERRARELRPFRDQAALRRAAESHSRDMVRRRYFAHVSPAGADVEARARRSGYLRDARRWDLGEALGWGILEESSPRQLVRALLESPEHRALLLDRSFRDIGIGVALGAPIDGDETPGVTLTIAFGDVERRC